MLIFADSMERGWLVGTWPVSAQPHSSMRWMEQISTKQTGHSTAGPAAIGARVQRTCFRVPWRS
jgi:hypothetical protein